MQQRDAVAQLAAFKWRLRLASVPELAMLAARGRIQEARFVWSAIGLLVDRTRQFLLQARKRNVNASAQTIEGGIGRGSQELRPRRAHE